MNKQKLVEIAQRNIEMRRIQAEDVARRAQEHLMENSTFATLERQLRRVQVQYAMGDHSDQTTQKLAQLKQQRKQLLAELGIQEGQLAPHYHCSKCDDTGYVNGQACSCLADEVRKMLIKQSNVANSTYTFENSTETDKHNLGMYNLAKTACQEGKNILLVGQTGTGKTYLITACANLALAGGKSVLFTTAYNLANSFLQAHISQLETRQAILDSITEVDVLVIDDLGTEKSYKTVTGDYLFAVINERIAQNKQTFISTNLSLQQIRDKYDERLFSRLVDQKITKVIKLVGADKRVDK